MLVKEVMSGDARYMSPDASLSQIAKEMRILDSGFVPVSDAQGENLAGVVTDRDVVIKALADGRHPETTTASEIMSHNVDYCFSEDDLETVCKTMKDKGIYRMVVLDNSDNKRLCGILSLGDLYRHDQRDLAASTAEGIVS